MGIAELKNDTGFSAALLMLQDEEGRDLLVSLVKATFMIEVRAGRLRPSEDQEPLRVEGEWHGEAGTSSMRSEPQAAFAKVTTDIALRGHARARKPGTTQVDVGLRVGALQKTVRAFGDRRWLGSMGVRTITRPLPFEKIPLVYEKAFGGWDRSHPDPQKHSFEPRNPLGVGFHAKGSKFEEGGFLPNLEDPAAPIRTYYDTPPPAGFGFIGMDWEPRRRYAGTYDDDWKKTRMPALPKNFQRRFFNAAHPDLIAAGFLRGDEEVHLTNASDAESLSFRLPGLRPPQSRATHRQAGRSEAQANLDTIIIDADLLKVLLVWRASMVLSQPVYGLAEVCIS